MYSEKASIITHHYQTQFYTTKIALFYPNYCTSTFQVNVMPYNQPGNHLKPTQYHPATALKELLKSPQKSYLRTQTLHHNQLFTKKKVGFLQL
jgi:hypothetical protein